VLANFVVIMASV